MNRTTTLPLAALLTALAAHAWAAPVSHFTPTGIEIDGNYLDDASPGEDWFPAFPPFQDPTRQDDDTLCGTSPAPKNDITNAYVANNFDFLYVGMERLANTGNTSFFFSFDVTGDGPSFGDFIFVFCFGSGEVVTDTYVLEYDTASAEFVRDATPPTVTFAVNLARTLAPFGALDRHGRLQSSIDPGKFGEASITLAEIEGFDVCAADDVTLEIQTKSSCSLSSQCKDTTGPLSFSFTSLSAALELSQPDGCAPVIVATAHATTPRGSQLTYTWLLDGEDITGDDPSRATSDTIAIELEPGDCGPHEIAVVADDGTCEVEDAAAIDVNEAPTAGVGSASVDACSGLLTFSASGSVDCDGDALTHAWDFDGDGDVDSTEASGTFAYSGCGERTVSLTVSDGTCTSEPVVTTVYVNAPPEAALAVTASAAHCLAIAFQVASTDCDSGQSSPLYSEALESTTDFGDGSPLSADTSGTHAYAGCGTFVVTTTTTDASGCTDTTSLTVTVDVIATVD